MPKRAYKMTVAGQMFKHLGLQMYSGAVPALAELISNAHDAMARTVKITIPLGHALTPDDKIIVVDDGHGMSFEEANQNYLMVGRDRRSGGNDWTKPYNGLSARKVQGRKGIGKLAGFGIADRIEIRSVRNKKIQHFALNYGELTSSANFADTTGYAPEVLADDGKATDEKNGTRVTLSRLKISRAVSEDQFRSGLARRLLVLDTNFQVKVNGALIKRDEIKFQFRFPETRGSWETTQLKNGQSIQWWAGFSNRPIQDEEQRGFVVYVRGKLAQTPWFFDLSGGVWGQHGMQYLTGEVKADFLDDSIDLIATDRGTVRWEDPTASPLKTWGQKKVRELLEKWTDRRREAKEKSPKIASLLRQAERLPPNEREIFKKVVDRIIGIPQLDTDREGKDIADELVQFAYNALTNRSFMTAIRRLNAAKPEDVAHFNEVLSEWDIIEAVNTAHLVKGRVEIIKKFEEMIDGRAPEKPDMQDYLREHPWLIDPKWTLLAHEQSLDALLEKQFNQGKRAKGGEGARRLDFFCIGDRALTAYVVEAKRPNALVGREEFNQLGDYVHYLRSQLIDAASPAHRRTLVKGLLIADRIRPGDEAHCREKETAGTFERRTWENLLHTTKSMHEDFLKVVKARAPADDPRIMQLDEAQAEKTLKKKKSKSKRASKVGKSKKIV